MRRRPGLRAARHSTRRNRSRVHRKARTRKVGLLRVRSHSAACTILDVLRRIGVTAAGMFALTALSGGVPISAAEDALPSDVARLLEAPPAPKPAEDPTGRYLLLVHQRDLLPARSLAQPVLSIVGVKINPRTYGRHAPIAYYGLTLVDLATGAETPLRLPRDAVIGFPIWAADGSRFAFTVTTDDGIELWVGEPGEARVRKLLGARLNATLSAPRKCMPDKRRLLCRLIDGEKRSTPPAYTADMLSQLTQPTMLRTVYQEQVVDQWAIRQYVESKLTLVDAGTGLEQSIGPAAAIDAAEPAPSGAFLLVSRMLPPYPQSDVDALRKEIQVWDRFGNIVRSFPVDARDGRTARAVQWHPSMPATLVWIERGDDGDYVLSQAAPFTGAPAEMFRTPVSYAGLDWLDGSGDALVSDYDPATRQKRVWLVDGASPPRVVGEVSVDAAFPDFGRPVTRRNRFGHQVVAVHDGGIYLNGQTLGPGGVQTYLDYMKLDSLETDRRWLSNGHGSESIVSLIAADGSALLTRHESSRQPPNYYVRAADGAYTRRVTAFEHPAEGIQNAHRVRLRYERPDGYQLSANLYLPPQHDSLEPLPVIIWAYPRVYGSDTRSVTTIAAERFPDFERSFKLFFLLQGYAVLDDVAMPVIGDGRDVNDTFIEQIVTNANAVIGAAAETGFIDAERVGVAGHSYGAFMVANLLAHSDLFTAGVAMSGAYNRTLTPFGFQTERRSLWEAQETYLAMSPFLYSNQIGEPLLLVHGLLDENAGTPPIQSIQFYEAIRHNGGNADILLLPREGHSYRGRESVLATAAAMLDFFDAHLKRSDRAPDDAPEVLRAANVQQAEPGGAKLAR